MWKCSYCCQFGRSSGTDAAPLVRPVKTCLIWPGPDLSQCCYSVYVFYVKNSRTGRRCEWFLRYTNEEFLSKAVVPVIKLQSNKYRRLIWHATSKNTWIQKHLWIFSNKRVQNYSKLKLKLELKLSYGQLIRSGFY